MPTGLPVPHDPNVPSVTVPDADDIEEDCKSVLVIPNAIGGVASICNSFVYDGLLDVKVILVETPVTVAPTGKAGKSIEIFEFV